MLIAGNTELEASYEFVLFICIIYYKKNLKLKQEH